MHVTCSEESCAMPSARPSVSAPLTEALHRSMSVKRDEHPLSGAAVSHAPSRCDSAGNGIDGVLRPISASAASEQEARAPSSALRLARPWPVTATCSVTDWSTMANLGFAVTDADVAAMQRAQTQRAARERWSESHWHRLCRGVPLLASADGATIATLRKAVRRYGLPRHLRAVMWLTLTGMASKVDENEYYCRTLLREYGYVAGPYKAVIEADLERTFPTHPYFSDKDIGLYKMKNVLHALCWRNPLLGYCQSFNYLTGFLLLVFDDEERCFWLLLHILETLLPNDFYSESLVGAKVDQVVLLKLVRLRLPRIAAHFDAIGFDVGALLPAWVMALFVNTFPVETTLRVWDYILTETVQPTQRTSAHLEVTLAVLKMAEEDILRSDNAHELMLWLRNFALRLHDAEALLRAARCCAVSAGQLHHLRRRAKPDVARELDERAALRAQLREQRAQEASRRQHAEWLAMRPQSASQGPSTGLLVVPAATGGVGCHAAGEQDDNDDDASAVARSVSASATMPSREPQECEMAELRHTS